MSRSAWFDSAFTRLHPDTLRAAMGLEREFATAYTLADCAGFSRPYGRRPAEAPRGTVTVVDEGSGEYRPTAGMLRLLKALRDTGQSCVDGADLYACRRRGLINHNGLLTPDGETLLGDYLGLERARG